MSQCPLLQPGIWIQTIVTVSVRGQGNTNLESPGKKETQLKSCPDRAGFEHTGGASYKLWVDIGAPAVVGVQRKLPALTNMTYKDGLGVKKKKAGGLNGVA